MKVLISLTNLQTKTEINLPNDKEYHFYDHARRALGDALGALTYIMKDGMYTAIVKFSDGTSVSFNLSCKNDMMTEIRD